MLVSAGRGGSGRQLREGEMGEGEAAFAPPKTMHAVRGG